MLALLFRSECADALVFKGGTSLSKVFGAIDRFSEDIDLSLSPAFAGIGGPTATQTRTQADLWMARAQEACGEAVVERISPALATLARKEFGAGIARRLAPEGDGTTLLFKYPSVLPSGFDYLQRSVRLEFGSLTDQQPTGRHPVRPWLAESLPEAFSDWSCEVVALDAERTFWEKATILHVEHHRPADRPMPDRYSRHYADLAMLASHPTVGRAVDRTDLCERVVRWKQSFFASAWARHDLARRGSFRLLPTTPRGDARHVPRATSVLRRSPRDACTARGAHQRVSAAGVRGDAGGFVAMKPWSAPLCTIAARPPPSHMRKVPLSCGFCI
jgi:hypothetical protein